VSEPNWELCPKSKDGGVHCECYFDGDACGWCGAPGMTEAEKEAQGMNNE
jgi:hypothetical protein